MNGRRVVGVAVFVSWVGMALSSNALAQEGVGAGATKEESAQVEQARQLYKDGVREAGRGRWEKARRLFLEAFRLRPHFQIAFNLGQAELQIGEFPKAAEHLAFFLREAQGAIGAEDRWRARGMFDEAERQVTTLVISTNQAGAEVLVDGVSVGTTPLGREVFVAPGRHVVEARLDGFQPVTDLRRGVAGAYLQIRLPLIKVGEPAPAAREVPDEAPTERGANKAVILTGIIAGAVALGTGVGFTLAANSKSAERDKAAKSCTTLGQLQCIKVNDIERTRNSFTAVAATSYVAAGLLGVGTLIYYGLKTPSTKPTGVARASRGSQVSATVLAGPGFAFATATMRW